MEWSVSDGSDESGRMGRQTVACHRSPETYPLYCSLLCSFQLSGISGMLLPKPSNTGEGVGVITSNSDPFPLFRSFLISSLKSFPRAEASSRSCGAAERWNAGLPADWTKLAGLQRPKYPQYLVHASSYVQVVHQLIADFALRIDDERSAESDTLPFDQYSVLSADFFGYIAEHREVDRPYSLRPCLVRVHAVRAGAQDDRVQLLKLRCPSTELKDFRWTDESEVEWPEEQNHPFAAILA